MKSPEMSQKVHGGVEALVGDDELVCGEDGDVTQVWEQLKAQFVVVVVEEERWEGRFVAGIAES